MPLLNQDPDNGTISHFTIDEFLDALGLPSEHPYLRNASIPYNHDCSAAKGCVQGTHIANSFNLSRGEEVCASIWPALQTSGCKCNGWIFEERCHVSSCTMGGIRSFLSNTYMKFLEVYPVLTSTILMILRMITPVAVLLSLSYLLIALPAVRLFSLRHKSSCDVNDFYQMSQKSVVTSANCRITRLLFCGSGLLSSAFILQDYMFIHEYSRKYLVSAYIMMSTLLWMQWKNLDFGHVYFHHRTDSHRRHIFFRVFVFPVALCALYRSIWCVTVERPLIQPGLYFDASNRFTASIVAEWPNDFRVYDDGRGTPWMINGDLRTGVPFLLYSLPEQKFVRRWVPTLEPGENEAVILDIAFPEDGIVRRDKPIYLLLHGLNGGSQEEYVRDFIFRRSREGCTIAVMVTRGLMDSPILGFNLPHFARTSDVEAAANAIREAVGLNHTIAGVGYSMGAITLANYVARSGRKCHLDAAVAISGALDTRQQPRYKHSTLAWQPFLAKTLRDTILGKFTNQCASHFTAEQLDKFSLADSMVSLDEALFVPYNGFEDLNHYYGEMGAMGDHVRFDGTFDEVGRIANVSIPMCVVNALDDPIGYWGTLGDPGQVTSSGKGYILMLLTRSGGHVGWPLGLNPSKNQWKWMSNVAGSFVDSVDRAFRKAHDHSRQCRYISQGNSTCEEGP